MATLSFSTLFRVDAIGAALADDRLHLADGFSTLFRVDAIGAAAVFAAATCFTTFQYPLSGRCYWSVTTDALFGILRGLFQYPLSGRCYWSDLTALSEVTASSGFSTLFRVDAIGAPPARPSRSR